MVNVKGGTRPPWVGLGAAVWLQIASGNAYNFPLYSHSLKSVLGFNQQQLTMLGVANDIGENVGLIPGLVCNKFPPWVVLLIGSFSCFFGYGVLWLSLSQTVQNLPYWLGGTRPPWVGLGTAVWLQIASGNAYYALFPLYSHSLKSVLGFNQQQLTMLGVANDIGENVGLIPGLVCNKFPPWVVLLIGSFSCLFGYGVLWLSLSQTVQNLPYWLGGTRPPWVGLGAAVWLQIASGNAYNFPLYSHSLKSVLGFNQQQLTMLAVANDIGENVGLIPGLVCNKFPPWVVLLIGSFSCFFGYGVLWLSLSQIVQNLPYWLLWIALCVATNSSAWFSTTVLVTNMRNFPLSRGTVAGILKGYGGLSAAVYTEVYSALLRNSSSKLVLFLALGVPTLSLLMMYFIRPCTPSLGEDSSESYHFLFVQVASIVLGVYVLTTTILDDVFSLNVYVSYTFLVIMVVLLMAPLAIPVKMTFYPSNKGKSGVSDASEKSEPLLTPSSSATNLGSFQEGDEISEVDMLLAEGEGAVKKKRRPRRGEDFKFTEALVKADFWLLFLVYFFGVGSGVTVLNNLAQIGIAQGLHDTKILLSLFSFCNFVGRLGGGVLSEYFVRLKALPRTVWMTCTQVVMIITYLLFASALNGTLYAATALLGICYGVQFTTMVPTASELFGLKHFGIIFNFMSLGNPLGAYLFSGLLAGFLYDNEAAKQHTSTCLGPNCFRVTFLILAGVCGLGTMLSIVLTMRIKPVYQMLYAGGSFRLPQSSNH